MKPIIIVPPKTLSAEDIKILRENDLCVVVASDPAKVKFIDPLPASSSRTEIENAAIQLSRKVLNPVTWRNGDTSEYTKMFVEILLEGTALSAKPTQQEQESRLYRDERFATVQRLAREDAKRDRDAAKQAAAEKAKAENKQ